MYAPTYAPHAATCYDGWAPAISVVRLHVDLDLDITEHTELLANRGIATTRGYVQYYAHPGYPARLIALRYQARLVSCQASVLTDSLLMFM